MAILASVILPFAGSEASIMIYSIQVMVYRLQVAHALYATMLISFIHSLKDVLQINT